LVQGCVHLGATDDGTSVSQNMGRVGRVINPAELPERGDGYLTPPEWQNRGLRFGTDELVSTIVYAGRDLERFHPGTRLSVADLSPERGGASRWHRSHQVGRDVDLIFVARSQDGLPVLAERMWRYGEDGQALAPAGGATIPEGDPVPDVFFDEAANWVVVRALIENPIAEVQYIFIADWLKQRLLDHALEKQEPEELVAQASYLLQQPADSLPHDDHMHVRVLCAPSDLAYGCNDAGTLRWVKKEYKYGRRALDSKVSLTLEQELLKTELPPVISL
jgi:penicillin-insensitive murein endopeptidase